MGACIVIPAATGLALTLTLLELAAQHPHRARHVLWPRVDQKTCLKCITAAGLIPVCIPCKLDGDELSADLAALEAKACELGHDRVLCVLATTSCFAPRAADDVVAISRFCASTGEAAAVWQPAVQPCSPAAGLVACFAAVLLLACMPPSCSCPCLLLMPSHPSQL